MCSKPGRAVRAAAPGRAAGGRAAPRAARARRGLGYNTTAAIYTVSLGVAGAASARVGNALGRGDARGARRAALAAVGLELALIAGVTGALFAGRDLWAALFTREPEVRRETGCVRASQAARVHALDRASGRGRAERLLSAGHRAPRDATARRADRRRMQAAGAAPAGVGVPARALLRVRRRAQLRVRRCAPRRRTSAPLQRRRCRPGGLSRSRAPPSSC